jgi:hypothetical protein
VVARGVLRRDEQALIVELDYIKKSFLKKFEESFFKGAGPVQEFRIPFSEIASLTCGWGWCKPPRSLLLRVDRLAVLAGMPGSRQGQVQLMIEPQDRPAARELLVSIARDSSEGGGPDPLGALFDREQARSAVRTAATGLFLSGLVTLLSWVAQVVVLEIPQAHYQLRTEWGFDPRLIAAPAMVLAAAVAGLTMTGAVLMLRLRCLPLAATAAIASMIPLSPGWFIGLPFGIMACVVLGKPEVAEAFWSDKRRPGSTTNDLSRSAHPIAGRLLSLFRSIGRYMVTTRHTDGKPSKAPAESGAAPRSESRPFPNRPPPGQA